MPLEIQRTLILSTAHVTPPELDAMLSEQGFPRIAVLDGGYGAIYSAALGHDYDDDLRDAGLPTVPALLDYARKHDCHYLRLDCDGPRSNELPILS